MLPIEKVIISHNDQDKTAQIQFLLPLGSYIQSLNGLMDIEHQLD